VYWMLGIVTRVTIVCSGGIFLYWMLGMYPSIVRLMREHPHDPRAQA
jgi:hypothetical protein